MYRVSHSLPNPPMKILQRNLNRSTFVVWEMKRNVSVLSLIVVTRSSNILISGKIIKEMPGSVASGTHGIKEYIEKYTGLNCIKRVSSHSRVWCRWWTQGSKTKRNFSIRKINVSPSRSRSMEGQQKRQLTSKSCCLFGRVYVNEVHFISLLFRSCFFCKQFTIQTYRKGCFDDYCYTSCVNRNV